MALCNIDLKKSLSPQVWPSVDRAYFSVSTLGASLLALKFPKYPFLNFSSGRYLILHLGRITRKGGQSPVLTLRNQGNHFHLPPSAPPSKCVGPPGALGSHEARRGWTVPCLLFRILEEGKGCSFHRHLAALKLICVGIHSIKVTFELLRNTESLAPLRGTESESAF